MLKFEPITKYEKGILFSLLSQSWAKVWNDELEQSLREFDKEVFENPDTVGDCVFISTLNSNPIGMASWDLRQGPQLGIIGHNCILPEYQGRGFGNTQIKEILKRLNGQRFKKVIVTTGEEPFFKPARKMYLSCRFKETKRYDSCYNPPHKSIDYEIDLVKHPENMKLIEPTAKLKSEFFAMAKEFQADSDDTINGIGSIDIDDFDASVCRAKDHAKGISLPDGWVPCSTFWLVRQERIIGTCSLRHELNNFLKSYGGHIGYSIRPSQRGNGYATKMLRLTLQKARALGIKNLLVTCDNDNTASARVIEKNGGKLADKVKTKYSKTLTRKYWIDLAVKD